MSELLFNCYDQKKNPYSYYYEINNDNIIEKFSTTNNMIESTPYVVCVNSDGSLFYIKDDDILNNPRWIDISDNIEWKNVSISNEHMIGVNTSGEVYYTTNITTPSFTRILNFNKSLRQISFDNYSKNLSGSADDFESETDDGTILYTNYSNLSDSPTITSFSTYKIYKISVSNGKGVSIGFDDRSISYSSNIKTVWSDDTWTNINNRSLLKYSSSQTNGIKLIDVSYNGYDDIICCLTESNQMYYANTNISSSSANWTLLSPTALFTSISLSGEHLFAVGTDNNIYYLDKYYIPTLINITKTGLTGKIIQISFDGYKINTTKPIITKKNTFSTISLLTSSYIYLSDSLKTQLEWKIQDIDSGTLKSISISNGQVFCTDNNNDIYYANDYKNPIWIKHRTGTLSQISFDGYANVVCGVDSYKIIYYSKTNINTFNPTWSRMLSTTITTNNEMDMVTISNGHVFGITSNKLYYKHTYTDDKEGFISVAMGNIPTYINKVSYDGYMNVVCCLASTSISSSKKIYYADSNIVMNPNWTSLDDENYYTNISLSNNQLYAVGTNKDLYFFSKYNDINTRSQITITGNLTILQISFDNYNMKISVSNNLKSSPIVSYMDTNTNNIIYGNTTINLSNIDGNTSSLIDGNRFLYFSISKNDNQTDC